jgi:hypothetical protein
MQACPSINLDTVKVSDRVAPGVFSHAARCSASAGSLSLRTRSAFVSRPPPLVFAPQIAR